MTIDREELAAIKARHENDKEHVFGFIRASLLDALEAAEARERRLREALRSMQNAAAAGLDIVRDESSPVFEFLAAIHRHSAAALIADAEPTNEAETAP